MPSRPVAHAVVAVLVVVAGLVGASGAQAAPLPRPERAYLATMKQGWTELSRRQQNTTCLAYRTDAEALVRKSIRNVTANPDSPDFTKASWRRIFTAYFTWACSGDGTTPR